MDRFWNKVDKGGACWLWTGATTPNGYGVFRLPGTHRNALAHRYAYEQEVGPIPAGQQLDHLCRTRLCVRPAHLEIVDSRTNQLRGDGASGRNARKTTCPEGHPYDSRHKNGRRECSTCKKAYRAAYRARTGK